MKNAKPRRRVTNLSFGSVDGNRAMAALEASEWYEDQIRSTPEGRRSDALRGDGHYLVSRDYRELAHEFFVRAAATHRADDEGAAAAASWFDLAMSTKDLRTGVRSQNLLEAERLFRRAETSPLRRADVRRHILSLDGLGQVLRAIALELPGEETRRAEALQHLQSAVKLARDHGIVTIDLLTNALTNLGNALRQAGRGDEAIHAHQESIRVAQRIGGLELARLRMNLVFALEDRGRRTDLVRALDIIDLIAAGDDAETTATANLVGYRIARRIKGARAERARSYLDRIDVDHLQTEPQLHFAMALAKEGEADGALVMARRGVGAALEQRRNAKSDADADHCAARAQRFARLAAELLVAANRPVQAFLALESAGGMRYFDSITRYAWAPTTPLLRALQELREQASHLSALLDDVAMRIAGIASVEHHEALHQILSALPEEAKNSPAVDFEWEGSAQRLDKVVKRALSSVTPCEVLREQSRMLERCAAAAEAEMAKRDPASAKTTHAWCGAATEASLDALFKEFLDIVLLRLSATSEDLLAVAVWKDEAGETTGKSERFPLRAGIIEAAFALTRDSPTRQIPELERARATLEGFLAEVDLKRVLPRRAAHVILLPSLVASLIPWAASGPPGATLLDAADAISYLPNLTPLLMRQAPMRLRGGTLVVLPGSAPAAAPTHFHELAFARLHDNESRSCKAAATKEAVCSRAAAADVLAFFAHGHYGEDAPAGAIKLADGDFNPAEHADTWHGMERVELWACRSGVNISYDPLTPWVDEAFGLDVIFHQLGVRSTIGTFWDVPDLVTALLVRAYRRAMSQGRSSPAALADAMRWWRAEGLAQTRRILESDAPARQLRELACELGIGDQRADASVAVTLGPVSTNGQVPPERVAELIRVWASPISWAGYRFLGVCERRAQGVATPMEARPLTLDERAVLEKCLT